MKRPKITNAYDLIGNMTSKQVTQEAARLFRGEMMTCVICGLKQESNPSIESNWRAIQVNEDTYYVCPNEFPSDDGTKEEFSQAYQKILLRILNGRRNNTL